MGGQMTLISKWARGALYVALAIVTFLVNDEPFRATVQPIVLSWMQAAAQGLLAVRAFLDLSAGFREGKTEGKEFTRSTMVTEFTGGAPTTDPNAAPD